ncbi:ribonuclease H2, subunit C [Vararia minispora EC-137]|uniref:Ribonuclease H2, subunit C n=1 Tax=Vararia minispora EC-137 TaxID=1314806 RepID=A0ACB8QX89_9AGAM|nr:ribonuclease H2, subunit C [Vararia minispora EC-137]
MSSISIAPTASIPDVTSPNLMPFHVAHTGTAPISAYLRPKAAPSSIAGHHTAIADNSSESPTERLIAAFRGRVMHGLRVRIPEGYTGLVLRARTETTSSSSHELEEKILRCSTGMNHSHSTEDDLDDNPYFPMSIEESEPTHSLTPSALFSSFVLWHPDIPVDDGRDEYLRSLSEWVKLSAEVRRTSSDQPNINPSCS